jgi:hypothetical protein
MATEILRRVNYRCDNLFFSGMAWMFLVFVFYGFASTYYLAGLYRAPLPNRMLHIHGAVFSTWILLLIVQTSLVAAHRVDVHRRLGMLGFGLACLMLVLGLMASADQLARHTVNPGTDTIEEVRAFYATPLTGILMFATFVYLGYRNRFRPAVHKRFMLFANLAILDAAFDRWPIFASVSLPILHILCFVPLVLLVMGYDCLSTGRVQRVTLWSSIVLLAVQQARDPIGHTAGWQHFAAWVAVHTPAFH